MPLISKSIAAEAAPTVRGGGLNGGALDPSGTMAPVRPGM
ncbi:hypothetical protein ACVW0Y_004487, partial [Pseudomonas sp. TE3786]